MPMPLQNNQYNNIKLLHELSCLVWFLQNHCYTDAKEAGDDESVVVYEALENILEEYIQKLKHKVCK